jgi:hypothetical protein
MERLIKLWDGLDDWLTVAMNLYARDIGIDNLIWLKIAIMSLLQRHLR